MSYRIPVEVTVYKDVTAEVHIEDVVEAINKLPMSDRWNHFARLVAEVSLSSYDLSPGQKTMVKNFLENQLKNFED